MGAQHRSALGPLLSRDYSLSWLRAMAEQLLAARRRKGLSVKRAAARIGVDEATLTKWERAKVPLRQNRGVFERPNEAFDRYPS